MTEAQRIRRRDSIATVVQIAHRENWTAEETADTIENIIAAYAGYDEPTGLASAMTELVREHSVFLTRQHA